MFNRKYRSSIPGPINQPVLVYQSVSKFWKRSWILLAFWPLPIPNLFITWHGTNIPNHPQHPRHSRARWMLLVDRSKPVTSAPLLRATSTQAWPLPQPISNLKQHRRNSLQKAVSRWLFTGFSWRVFRYGGGGMFQQGWRIQIGSITWGLGDWFQILRPWNTDFFETDSLGSLRRPDVLPSGKLT